MHKVHRRTDRRTDRDPTFPLLGLLSEPKKVLSCLLIVYFLKYQVQSKGKFHKYLLWSFWPSSCEPVLCPVSQWLWRQDNNSPCVSFSLLRTCRACPCYARELTHAQDIQNVLRGTGGQDVMITWTQRPQTSYEKLSEEVVRGTCTCQYHLLNMTFQCEVQIIIQIRSGDLDLF